MAANELKQKDLLDIFGTPSIVSEVLSGKRKFTTDHIRSWPGDFTFRQTYSFEAASPKHLLAKSKFLRYAEPLVFFVCLSAAGS